MRGTDSTLCYSENTLSTTTVSTQPLTHSSEDRSHTAGYAQRKHGLGGGEGTTLGCSRAPPGSGHHFRCSQHRPAPQILFPNAALSPGVFLSPSMCFGSNGKNAAKMLTGSSGALPQFPRGSWGAEFRSQD